MLLKAENNEIRLKKGNGHSFYLQLMSSGIVIRLKIFNI